MPKQKETQKPLPKSTQRKSGTNTSTTTTETLPQSKTSRGQTKATNETQTQKELENLPKNRGQNSDSSNESVSQKEISDFIDDENLDIDNDEIEETLGGYIQRELNDNISLPHSPNAATFKQKDENWQGPTMDKPGQKVPLDDNTHHQIETQSNSQSNTMLLTLLSMILLMGVLLVVLLLPDSYKLALIKVLDNTQLGGYSSMVSPRFDPNPITVNIPSDTELSSPNNGNDEILILLRENTNELIREGVDETVLVNDNQLNELSIQANSVNEYSMNEIDSIPIEIPNSSSMFDLPEDLVALNTKSESFASTEFGLIQPFNLNAPSESLRIRPSPSNQINNWESSDLLVQILSELQDIKSYTNQLTEYFQGQVIKNDLPATSENNKTNADKTIVVSSSLTGIDSVGMSSEPMLYDGKAPQFVDASQPKTPFSSSNLQPPLNQRETLLQAANQELNSTLNEESQSTETPTQSIGHTFSNHENTIDGDYFSGLGKILSIRIFPNGQLIDVENGIVFLERQN